MPVRMSESDRIRGTKRVMIFIANVRTFGKITCHYCEKQIVFSFPHVDHFVTRKNGCDAKDINNCIVACEVCNGKKSGKSVIEVFGIEKHNEITKFMNTRIFTPNDLVMARKINKEFTQTKDVLTAVIKYCKG